MAIYYIRKIIILDNYDLYKIDFVYYCIIFKVIKNDKVNN